MGAFTNTGKLSLFKLNRTSFWLQRGQPSLFALLHTGLMVCYDRNYRAIHQLFVVAEL